MTQREIDTLNRLVQLAVETKFHRLNPVERDVALMVSTWAVDGVPVRQICPHCGDPAPTSNSRGEDRGRWLRDHVDSTSHRFWWGVKHKLRMV
jgi:hypothetical protein